MVHDTVWGKISTLNEIYRRRLKPKSTPNFSNLGPVNLRDRPMLATKLVLLVFFWRMFAMILLHDVRESLPKWSLNWVTIVFGCQDDHQHREYLPVSEVVLLALHVARRSFMPYSHMGPSVEQFFGIKLYHTVWWQYVLVVFKTLNHFEYTWLHLFFDFAVLDWIVEIIPRTHRDMYMSLPHYWPTFKNSEFLTGGFSYATKNAEARAAAMVYGTRDRVRPQTTWLIWFLGMIVRGGDTTNLQTSFLMMRRV